MDFRKHLTKKDLSSYQSALYYQ